MGAYDIPAMIDFILKNTGEKTLSYMGHSQGTSQMFSALSENKDDIQKKIKYCAQSIFGFVGGNLPVAGHSL